MLSALVKKTRQTAFPVADKVQTSTEYYTNSRSLRISLSLHDMVASSSSSSFHRASPYRQYEIKALPCLSISLAGSSTVQLPDRCNPVVII
jgi:hypothetical protein